MDKSTAVPDGAPSHGHPASNTAKRRSKTPDLVATASTTSTGGQNSKQSSGNSSAAASPHASRDPSPTRRPRRTASANRIVGNRPRKNSQHDPSPSRQSRPSLPGPTHSSRSLSSISTPTLLPASQEQQQQSHAPTPQKLRTIEVRDGPKWPVSPRLRSPPPTQLIGSGIPVRRSEPDLPAISVQRPSPSPKPEQQSVTSESEMEESHVHSGIRTPIRAALETVQEVSLPNSPIPTNDALLMEKVKEKLSGSETALSDVRTLRSRPSLAAQESGSESGNSRPERRTTSVPPPMITRQSSALSAKQMRLKPEGPTQSMTVETETVPSVPQVALATGPKVEANGTLRTKPSSETIKPKKEKRKTARKQPAVNPGTASSKADIFEAKIASAIDETNTSDSEETFVYDSNPPDTNDRAARRFHSRTPSATSMVSQADRQNLRSIYGIMEGAGPAHGPRKGMKFVNTFNNTNNGNESSGLGEEEGKISGRSAGGSGRGTARHHHHIGRWGRQPGNGHPSLFDNESPFPNAARSKLTSSRNSSGPPSPRNQHQHSARSAFNKRTAMQMSSSYEFDDTTGADDERTPLMGSMRSSRSGRNRRGPHTLRQAESQSFNRRQSYLNRFAAFLVLAMMLMLVVTGAIGFMFATSQPMTDIEITAIRNVVTSEQVLLFDLTVKAHNPNIVVVTIDQANLEIFAKSEFAGTDSDWWENPEGPENLGPLGKPSRGPFDDPNDDDDQKPNVLLGSITEFDSPLTFEGSLFHQGTSSSTGQVQLPYPGNQTSGGSRRWERIFQNEFDLIVKGVVKYSLPLSARVRSATVSGRKTIQPNSANDPSLQPNSTTLDSKH